MPKIIPIGCLYIPHFPVWVFERLARNSRAKTRPLVVISSRQVVAANKAARRAGVEPGISSERAQTLCPEAAIKLRNPDLEEAMWEEVLHGINCITPFLESAGRPYAFFNPDDLPAMRAHTSEMGAQAGVAASRSMAQLAALRAAPGNLLVVRRAATTAFLNRFPVERLVELAFEPDTIALLTLFGYPTLGHVATLSQHHLAAQFGDDGKRLHALLHPEKTTPVPLFRPPRVIRASYDLDQPGTEPGDLEPVLSHLVCRAAHDLGMERCRRLQVALRNYRQTAPLFVSRVLAEPAGDPRTLLNVAEILLRQLVAPGMEVESMAVELGALRSATPAQAALFHRRPSIYKAARAMHRRFPGMLKRAAVQPSMFFEDEMVLEPFPDEEPPRRRRRPDRPAIP